MERSYDFTLPQEYQLIGRPKYELGSPIRNAREQHWISLYNCISEQTFDGRYGYLYYYEFWMEREETIPVYTTLGDLHLTYCLQSDSPIRQRHHTHDFVMDFFEGWGAYLYIAKGEYGITVPKGHHILVGFILDAGLFRPPASRHFNFLQHLVTARKEQSSKADKSVTFRVGEVTRRQLQQLFSKINPNILDNEHMLLKHLIFLIQLSRFKLLGDNQEKLIDQARNLLQITILHQGAKTRLSDIAKVLLVSRDHINAEHKKHYGCKFHDYRNQLLLDLVASIIIGNEKLATTAEECGFSSINELNKFVKNQIGFTALTFKQQQQSIYNNDSGAVNDPIDPFTSS
ncbi:MULTISPECIES: helix-turn-helix domain-containing protein [Sphingobacterium]|uniref:helix-turn-helix domain-containing protein n=1 Tax=Sphingobacterium TaxID=28453 RepID=UPI00257B0C23|nr:MULTISPECIES: helix-turn-helix domain-containing protein [Sphingobacterium]